MSTTMDVAACRILVVDDEEANVALLSALLEDDGFSNVACTRDPRVAVELYDSFAPDLVLLDLHMPHMSGFEVMEQLAARKAADEFVPIIVLTADVNPDSRLRALGHGANDFLTKPLDAMEVMLRIRNLLATRLLHLQQRASRDRAEAGKRRAEFLSEASRALGASLDVQTTLGNLPRLAVPRRADYSVIELEDGDGSRRTVGAAHVDSNRDALLTEGAELLREGAVVLGDGTALLAEGTPLLGGALPHAHPGAEALAEGRVLLLESTGPAELAANGATDAERDALHRLQPKSLIIVPLLLSGSVAGRLTLAMSTSGRRFDADDVALVEELMRRAVGALDNARLYDNAQRATRARDHILAVVAHDLRNPLSTIRMVADMMIEDDGDSPHRRQFEMVRRATLRMDELIGNLMEVTRLESGKLALHRQPEAVPVLVAEAASMLSPIAAARGISLETEFDDALPLIMADERRLLQVISNLVGNAVKFTERGGRIRIRCTAAADEVLFAVEDTGRGIPPDQLPHVFGTFWQASADDRRGIGLGLSIARGIVEGHGGRIWVESEVGHGSTFNFTVPVAGEGGGAGEGLREPRVGALREQGAGERPIREQPVR